MPNVAVANLHSRFTGISATVLSLVPEQRKLIEVAVVDWGGLGLDGCWTLRQLWLAGFRRPENARFRVLHCRRGVDMAAGILLRATPGQRWRLLFTTAANKPPGRTLRSLMNSMDAIVATSEKSAGLVPWHSIIVPHGVDISYFRPAEEASGSRRVIGYAGRIRRSKGADLFVRAMIRLLPSWPGYTAELAGLCRPRHKDFQKDLQREIAANNLEERIRFRGHAGRAELLEFYRKLAICVTPSRIEGFGLVPLEAMACGTPVVTSDASPVWPRIVDEQAGAVARSGDLKSLMSAIGNLLARPDLGGGMRSAARERVERHHPISGEAAELAAIYRQLMRGRKFPRLKGERAPPRGRAATEER